MLGPFEEEEEGTGIASDVVRVKGEDPATSITTYVMQRPIQFTDEMKHKDAFKPFAEKWTAKKNSMQALEFTMRQPDMLPTVRPPDDSPTRIAFTVHGISLPHITMRLGTSVHVN